MDYIDGGSLNDLRQRGVNPVRALRLCADACRALDVLHAHDIIHRDVTSGNLLLSQSANGDAQVLIADLGVAKSMVGAVDATMTAGTPSYMAPEQAMRVTPLDKRVDIYSLTAVTYAMLAGHPPFLVRSIADILARDISKPPEPIAERLGAPVTLDAAMLSGLAADRNRRPPTALLLADALETIAGQMDPTGASTQVPEASVMTYPAPRTQPPAASEITIPDLPPLTELDLSSASPPKRGAAVGNRWSVSHDSGLPVAAVRRQLSQFWGSVRNEPADDVAIGSHRSVTTCLLLRLPGCLSARAFRDLDVRDDPGAALNCSPLTSDRTAAHLAWLITATREPY